MIEMIFIMSIVSIYIFMNFVSASKVGLIENSQWGDNLTGVRFSATAFGDLDNDGDLDLVLTGCLPGAGADRCTVGTIAKIYINNGSTLTENSTWQNNLTGVGWSSLAFGDIDNDEDLDLVLTGCTNASDQGATCNGKIINKIYINNGSALTENSAWQQNLTAVFDSSIALGDIDNDGDLDLINIGRTGGGDISKIYINNGTTLIESERWQNNLTGVYEGGVVLGDIDNDGDLDLALTGDAGTSQLTTKIYLNNGTTLMESEQWQNNLTNMDRSTVTFGDYDNDGDLDLALTGHTTGDNWYIYDNNKTTLIINQTQTNDPLIGIYRTSIAFGDYDNDGDLDLIGIGHEIGYARIYENNESNNYYFVKDAMAHSNISDDFFKGSLAWADLDGDGDLDLIIAASELNLGSISRIYINNNTISNTQSTPPTTNLSSNYSSANAILNLSWGNGSDVETNTSGLYYNLMVGNSTTNHTIVSGVYGGSSGGGGGAGGGASGYFGNMMQRKSISLNVNLSNGTYYWYVQTIDTGLAKSNWSDAQNFTVGTVSDSTAPIISSISSSVTSSTATIIWTTDENSNSSVLYGTTTALGSSSGSASLVTSHSIGLGSLSASTLYYYNVSSCDTSNNCNVSSQYNFTTSATPVDNGNGGSSGGGGSSTTTTPTLKEFDVDFSNVETGSIEAKQGDIKTFSFNSQIKHSITVMTLTTNSVTLLITSNPITIQINKGETKQIDINEDNINDFEIKLVSIINKKANLLLKKLEGADILSKEELEEAVRKEALFDVKVMILEQSEEVFAGEEVSAKIEVFNINNIGQVDVVVDYWLSDSNLSNATILAKGFDTLAVEAVTSFVRSLIIPEDTSPGTYYFGVDVSYKNFTTSSNTEFKVKSLKRKFIEERFKEIVISAIALIAIAIFVYLRMIKKKEEKLEKEVKKLKSRNWKFWRKKIKRRKNGSYKNR